MERREFIHAALAAGATAAVAGSEVSCGNDVRPPPTIDAAVDPTGSVLIDLLQHPELSAEGGSVTVRITGAAPGQPAALLVAQPNPNVFIAVEAACPHLGCPLGYQKAEQLIECPCHQSRFSALADPGSGKCAGAVLHPPAKSDLRTFSAGLLLHTNTVAIDLNPTAGLPPKLALPLAEYPALATVGGSAIIHVGCTPVVVVRTGAATVAATSAVCTHQGCTVGYDAASGDLECPCHGSIYRTDGTLIQKASGNTAPQANLASYPATLDADSVVVTFS
jgi:Rieske Fe-S protein